MKKFGKAVAAAMAATMVMSLGACGADSGSTQAGKGSSSDGKTYTVGICQLVQHEALDAATKGFKDALTDKLGDRVKFDEQNAAGDASTCSTICTTFATNNYDLILGNATAALQAAAAATDTIPILGTSVTDYATALAMSDWTGTTGKNISGTTVKERCWTCISHGHAVWNICEHRQIIVAVTKDIGVFLAKTIMIQNILDTGRFAISMRNIFTEISATVNTGKILITYLTKLSKLCGLLEPGNKFITCKIRGCVRVRHMIIKACKLSV